MPKAVDKLEEAKRLIGDIAKDAQEALTLTQFVIPTAEGVVTRVKQRIVDIEKLFSPEDRNGRRS
jgi:hypothetical protein